MIYPENSNYNYPYESYGVIYDYKYMKKNFDRMMCEFYDHNDNVFIIRTNVECEKNIEIRLYKKDDPKTCILFITTSYEGFLEMIRYGKQLGEITPYF